MASYYTWKGKGILIDINMNSLTLGSYCWWRCGMISSKFIFVLLCCHGNIVSPWRSLKPILFGVAPSQQIIGIPELSNNTSFDFGVLCFMEMWNFQVQNSFLFGVVACHGSFISTLRESKAHWKGNSPSPHKSKIPELPNDTSLDFGVLLFMKMWHFQVQNLFCLVVKSWHYFLALENPWSPFIWYCTLTT
jgi:hypothetical protein